jgi:peptide-methionine (S)-S-oxide reductase
VNDSLQENLANDPPPSKIGLGGGCHWCTEGVFASLRGVLAVQQGWIAPKDLKDNYSEAIEVLFNPSIIGLHDIINIHLHTHAASSEHSMRAKYRSAVYVYDQQQYQQAHTSLSSLADQFERPIITQVFYFDSFKSNKAELLDYFYSSPNRPFCQTYIHPKLTILLKKFKTHLNTDKLSNAGINLVDQ